MAVRHVILGGDTSNDVSKESRHGNIPRAFSAAIKASYQRFILKVAPLAAAAFGKVYRRLLYAQPVQVFELGDRSTKFVRRINFANDLAFLCPLRRGAQHPRSCNLVDTSLGASTGICGQENLCPRMPVLAPNW